MEKIISPAYQISGKRKKLTGYIGELRDGETIISSLEYSTHAEAETALDALAFDILSDQFQHGLIDEPPPFDPSTCCFCSKPHAAQTCPDMRALLFAPDSVQHFCACGKPATHDVSFADTPHNVYYCDTHIAGSYYISTDLRTGAIVGPHLPLDNECETCGGDGDCPDCDPDAHYSALEMAESQRLDTLEYERELSYSHAFVSPFDVDFAPTGFEV